MTAIKVDEAEARAEQYLKHVGWTNIERQPEGEGKFPDFRVDRQIGVEVRRLKISTLQETGSLLSNDHWARPVCDNLRELLSASGPPIDGGSWFVRVQFRRPLLKWAKLKRVIQDRLQVFHDGPVDQTILEVNANFHLKLHRAGNTHTHCFLYGAYDDLDNRGYFVEHERKRNLDLCIGEKTTKRNKAVLKHEYSKWWLIFEDHIGYGYPLELSEQMRVQHDWDRVILLSPIDPTIYCEL